MLYGFIYIVFELLERIVNLIYFVGGMCGLSFNFIGHATDIRSHYYGEGSKEKG